VSYHFLLNFGAFQSSGKIKNSKMADPRWPPFKSMSIMSQACVVGFKGKDFRHTICPLARFRCHTFNILEVKEGWRGGGSKTK